MNVLALDIDGVLNSAAFLRGVTHNSEEGRYLRRHHPTRMIDPAAVRRLNRVLAATGAVCLLSSAWRIVHPHIEDMQAILEQRGFVGRIVGKTPVPEGAYDGSPPETWGCRCDEIQAWLDGPHPHEKLVWGRPFVFGKTRGEQIERFAIVDDSDDMGHLKPYLVRTTWAGGLQDEHVGPLITMLGGG